MKAKVASAQSQRRCWLAIAGAALLVASGVATAQELVRQQRQDRQTTQWMAYAPSVAACRGVAIISPGAGGSEQGYRYLGEAMAELGFLATVLGHRESGRLALREHVRGSGLREGLAELITEPHAYHGRFMDIEAARQWTATRCPSRKSVLIGHSMGAATAMMEAGARNKLGVRGTDAFDAYIALSPQGAGSIFDEDAWSDIGKPVLMLTGTRDNELGGASWETRTQAFKNMKAGCKWLGVIDGATHMHFAGNGMSRRTEVLSTRTIASFLAAMERGDCSKPPQAAGMAIERK